VIAVWVIGVGINAGTTQPTRDLQVLKIPKVKYEIH